MRIGIVDLDTSHPQNWIPIERELGHEIVGVYDSGAVHPSEYVREFADKHGIPRVFDSLEQLVEAVDVGIIHGCDWDTHAAKARPFVEAGRAVLIDKPIAGNLADLEQIRNWAQQGARITGGSGLCYCHESRQFLDEPVEQRGAPHVVYCGCGVDEFNYGIHAYALLSSLMGPGIERVRHLGQSVQRQIRVTWKDGRTGLLSVGGEVKWLPFHATVVTDRKVHQFIVDNRRIYRSLLEATLPYLAGEAGEPPIPVAELIEPELCALAARQSWLHDDQEVNLHELTLTDSGYDGAVFAEDYRKAKYPE